jgi:hypothetical protein
MSFWNLQLYINLKLRKIAQKITSQVMNFKEHNILIMSGKVSD